MGLFLIVGIVIPSKLIQVLFDANPQSAWQFAIWIPCILAAFAIGVWSDKVAERREK